MSSKNLPGGRVLGTGADDDRRANTVIKAGGIYSMAETREADARSFKAMAIRDGWIVALAAEPGQARRPQGPGEQRRPAADRVTAATPAPEGGVIERDATGEPTGRFEDSAIALVEQLLPAPSFDEQIEGLRLASAGYAADAARFVGDGPIRGILAPGKLADFAACPADPFLPAGTTSWPGSCRFSPSSAAARVTTLAGSSPARTRRPGPEGEPGARAGWISGISRA